MDIDNGNPLFANEKPSKYQLRNRNKNKEILNNNKITKHYKNLLEIKICLTDVLKYSNYHTVLFNGTKEKNDNHSRNSCINNSKTNSFENVTIKVPDTTDNTSKMMDTNKKLPATSRKILTRLSKRKRYCSDVEDDELDDLGSKTNNWPQHMYMIRPDVVSKSDSPSVCLKSKKYRRINSFMDSDVSTSKESLDTLVDCHSIHTESDDVSLYRNHKNMLSEDQTTKLKIRLTRINSDMQICQQMSAIDEEVIDERVVSQSPRKLRKQTNDQTRPKTNYSSKKHDFKIQTNEQLLERDQLAAGSEEPARSFLEKLGLQRSLQHTQSSNHSGKCISKVHTAAALCNGEHTLPTETGDNKNRNLSELSSDSSIAHSEVIENEISSAHSSLSRKLNDSSVSSSNESKRDDSNSESGSDSGSDSEFNSDSVSDVSDSPGDERELENENAHKRTIQLLKDTNCTKVSVLLQKLDEKEFTKQEVRKDLIADPCGKCVKTSDAEPGGKCVKTSDAEPCGKCVKTSDAEPCGKCVKTSDAEPKLGDPAGTKITLVLKRPKVIKDFKGPIRLERPRRDLPSMKKAKFCVRETIAKLTSHHRLFSNAKLTDGFIDHSLSSSATQDEASKESLTDTVCVSASVKGNEFTDDVNTDSPEKITCRISLDRLSAAVLLCINEMLRKRICGDVKACDSRQTGNNEFTRVGSSPGKPSGNQELLDSSLDISKLTRTCDILNNNTLQSVSVAPVVKRQLTDDTLEAHPPKTNHLVVAEEAGGLIVTLETPKMVVRPTQSLHVHQVPIVVGTAAKKVNCKHVSPKKPGQEGTLPRKSPWKDLNNKLLNKCDLLQSSGLQKLTKHVLTFPKTFPPVYRPPSRTENTQAANELDTSMTKSEPAAASKPAQPGTDSFAAPLTRTLMEPPVAPPSVIPLTPQGPQKNTLFDQSNDHSALASRPYKKEPSTMQRNLNVSDDIISIYAESTLIADFPNDSEEDPSPQNKQVLPNKMGLNTTMERAAELLENVVESNLSNEYVVKWLENQSVSSESVVQDKVMEKSSEENTALQYLCPNIKDCGSCNNKMTCTYMHPLNLQKNCEDLSLAAQQQEYTHAKRMKHHFLYQILFYILCKHYGEQKDFNKLSELVTDILLLDINIDRTPFVLKIIQSMCLSGLSPQSAVEIVFRKADVPKTTCDHLADILLNVLLKSYNLEESWTTIMILVKSKDFDVDSNFIEDILQICTRGPEPNFAMCRKAYSDIFKHVDARKFKHVDPNMFVFLRNTGLADIANHLQKMHDTNFGNSETTIDPLPQNTLLPPMSVIFNFPPPPINQLGCISLQPVPYFPIADTQQPAINAPVPAYNRPPSSSQSSVSEMDATSNPEVQPQTHSQLPFLQPVFKPRIDLSEVRELMTTEKVIEFICLVKNFINQSWKCSNLLRMCVDVVQSTSNQWSLFYYKFLTNFKALENFKNNNQYPNFLATLGVNMVICLVNKDQWAQAGCIANLLFEFTKLNKIRLFTIEKYSENRKMLILLEVFINSEKFRSAWTFICNYNLCKNANEFNLQLSPEEAIYRNILFDKMMDHLTQNKMKLALVILNFLISRNCLEINVNRFLDSLIVLALNLNYKPDFFIQIMHKIPRWSDLVKPTTIRALVALLIKDRSCKHILPQLYFVACDMHIYKPFSGLETVLEVSINFLEEEMYFVLQNYLIMKRKQLPLLTQMMIKFMDTHPLVLDPNMPNVLLHNMTSVDIAMGRMRNILTKRMVPPLQSKSLSRYELSIHPESLLNHFTHFHA